MFRVRGNIERGGPSYSELPTPASTAEYIAVGEDTVKWASDMITRVDWKPHEYGDKRVQLFTTTSKASLVSVMCTTTLPAPADIAAKYTDDLRYETRKTVEDDLLSAEVVSRYGPVTVHTSRYSAPFPVSGREFVVAYYCKGW